MFRLQQLMNLPIFALTNALLRVMPNRLTLIALVTALSTTVAAQEAETSPDVATGSVETGTSLPTDSLHLPMMTSMGLMPRIGYIGLAPFSWRHYPEWQLHEGLNVSLEAGVFAMLGKGVPHSAGFTNSVGLQYAVPLSQRLSFSIGGYVNHTDWANASFADAGLSGVLSYRLNEHWEGYIYGQKSLMSTNRIPLPLYDMHAFGDRIGAAVKYNFNPNLSVTLSVEDHKYPDFMPPPPHGHNSHSKER